jgi:hypothetical protein
MRLAKGPRRKNRRLTRRGGRRCACARGARSRRLPHRLLDAVDFEQPRQIPARIDCREQMRRKQRPPADLTLATMVLADERHRQPHLLCKGSRAPKHVRKRRTARSVSIGPRHRVHPISGCATRCASKRRRNSPSGIIDFKTIIVIGLQ